MPIFGYNDYTYIKGGIMQKGDDMVTTFLGGCLGIVIFGIVIISILAWVF
jgi:hypothetical protein